MEGRTNVAILFMALFAAGMLQQHASLAQVTTHVVGDTLGWLVPTGGNVTYRTWAASRTFRVGDVLVFNFTTGTHDVAEVREADYNSCNSGSPISMSTDGPARITLSSPGERYFICTFPRHCGLGQRLSINVSAASTQTPATAPAPETAPTPAAAARPPAASRTAPTTHVVGDRLGWLVPPGGPVAYQVWARGRRFVVGDNLVFNFTGGAHNVLQVTRGEFDSCTTSTTTAAPITTSPARITLTAPGEHFYICTFPQHCSSGQKLAINVTGTPVSASPPPSSAGGPSSQPNNPSTTSTQSDNSASSFAAIKPPFTFLPIALALFMYN